MGLSGLSGPSGGGLDGVLGFCYSKIRPNMRPDKTDKTDSPLPGPGELGTCPESWQATFFREPGEGLSGLSGLSVGSSGSFWSRVSTKTCPTRNLTNLTKPDNCFRDPGTATRFVGEGPDSGVVRFVRSVRRGLGRGFGLLLQQNQAKHAT